MDALQQAYHFDRLEMDFPELLENDDYLAIKTAIDEKQEEVDDMKTVIDESIISIKSGLEDLENELKCGR